jgi:hypothetical protein
MIAKLAWRWSRRGLVDGEIPPDGLSIESWPRLKHKSFALMLAKSAY